MSSDDEPATSYQFVPIVREGFRPKGNEFELARPADSKGDRMEGPLTVPVDITIEAHEKDGEWVSPENNQVSKDVRMYGPGDVSGIDQDQIVRVEPEPDTADFPPNYFPLVEFDRPDLPWLFSPERTSDDETKRARARPWIALVVVDKSEVTMTSDGGGNLPVLEAPASELPPPSETWAWAHAQVVGGDDDASAVIGEEPSRTVSRLLCPRNLHGEEGDSSYVAAVVPTFEPGRRAGLGREPYPDSDGKTGDSDESSENGNGENGDGQGNRQPIEFAWSADGEEETRLPVYYMWEFTVGSDSRDFESLVDELTPEKLSETDVGTREVDASHPGPETLVENLTIDQVGALQSPSVTPTEYPSDKQDEIQSLLNRPHEISEQIDRPVVGAPIYGQWYPDVDQVHDPPDEVPWLRQLNRNPTYRIAAGMGAKVVRENQETYVAEAWDQAGQLRETNRLLQEGQMARAASNRVYERLKQEVGPTGEKNVARLLQFTQPLHGRVSESPEGLAEIGRSVRKQLEAEVSFPGSVLSPAYRRLTSPRGALGRNANIDPDQQPNVTGNGPIPPTAYVEEFSSGRVTPQELEPDLDPRVVTLDNMAPDTSQTMMLSSGETDEATGSFPEESAPPSTIDASAAEFTSVPEIQDFEPITASPDVGFSSAGDGQPPLDESDLPTEDLESIHRFADWARSLPEGTLEPADVRTATPGEPEAFALRKVDAQLQSGVRHCRTAIETLAALSTQFSDGGPAATTDSGGPAPESDERRDQSTPGDVSVEAARDDVEAIATNTFGPLNRTLDSLLSTRTGGIPAAIEYDKDSLVQGLVDDSEAALGAIGGVRGTTGGDPPDGGDGRPGGDTGQRAGDAVERIDEAIAAVRRARQRLEQFRGSLNLGEQFQQPQTLTDDESAGIADSGETAEVKQFEESGSLLGQLDPDVTVPEKVHARIGIDGGGSGRARSDGSGLSLRSRADPLEPVMWAPSFEQPMFDPLSALSEQHLLPGAADVPRKSIGALATNPEFVESFLLGLNHEFARELLWRRFPTDRRGTYFRTFWNKVQNPMPSAEEGPDIDEIHDWNDEGLGSNIGSPNVVVVVRGELLRQFPNTSIYMVRAKWKASENDETAPYIRIPKLSEAKHVTKENVRKLRNDEDPTNDPSGKIEFPIFRGNLDPDITFLGFDVSPTTAVGGDLADGESLEDMSKSELPDPGWFVVFEEPMGETRFGLDEGDESTAKNAPMGVEPASGKDPDEPIDKQQAKSGKEVAWNGLSWHHVAEESPSNLKHVKIWESPPGGNQAPNDGIDPSKSWRVSESKAKELANKVGEVKPDVESSFAVWGRNGAHMARITFQRPVRMVMHADYLLGAEADSSTDWERATGESDADEYPKYPDVVESGDEVSTVDVDGTDEFGLVDEEDLNISESDDESASTFDDTLHDESIEDVSIETDDGDDEDDGGEQ